MCWCPMHQKTQSWMRHYRDMNPCRITSKFPISIQLQTRLLQRQYTDSSVTSNSMIVVSSARSRVIDYNDVYTYSYDYSSYSRSIDGYDAEGQLTSAIQYVTMDSTELPVIYQVSGHGETALTGGFTEAIEKANITLSDLALLKEDAVPEDAKKDLLSMNDD